MSRFVFTWHAVYEEEVTTNGTMARTNYPSDLMEGQWQILRRLLLKRAKRGRRLIDRREIINAILSVDRTGCPWRALPHDFPPLEESWKTGYNLYQQWL